MANTARVAWKGERCFACGQLLRRAPAIADTRDDQLVSVGPDCYRQILAAGPAGYQPPKGGPRLWPLRLTE